MDNSKFRDIYWSTVLCPSLDWKKSKPPLPSLMFTLRRVGDVAPAHSRNVSDFVRMVQKAKKVRSDLANPSVKDLKKVGRVMIDAVKDDNRPGWRHTYKKHGPTKKLRDRLEMPEVLSNERYKFFSGGHVLEDMTMEGLVERATLLQTAQPGAFVEIRRYACDICLPTQNEADELCVQK